MRSTGAAPKPDGQKVTRHKPTVDTVVLPAEGRRSAAPPPIVELDASGAQVWAAVWSRPEAAMWSDADVPAMSRLVFLQTSPGVWLDSRLLAEMRQLEDRFGMNPYARKQLRWVVGEPAGEASVRSTSGKRRLSVVDAAG